MSALKLGTLRRYITIQRLDLTPTSDGATVGTATTVCHTWASIEPFGGREAWMVKAQQATSSHRIRMLYRDGITPAMQALWNGRVFNFTSVNNVGELGRELEIIATEVVAT